MFAANATAYKSPAERVFQLSAYGLANTVLTFAALSVSDRNWRLQGGLYSMLSRAEVLTVYNFGVNSLFLSLCCWLANHCPLYSFLMNYSLHTEILLQHIHFAPVAISKTISKHHLSSSLCHTHPVRAALKGAAPFYNNCLTA